MVHTIQDLYSAEQQALVAMPKLMALVQNDHVRQAFATHHRETQQQVIRLEQIAQHLGVNPDGETCLAMQGLIKETQSLLEELEPGQLADAAIIGAAQKMEHYEIASYGTARTLAWQAGQKQAADLLELTLREEKAADTKLTKIATTEVNQKAAQA